MGRSRSKARKAGIQPSPGLAVAVDPMFPLFSKTYPQNVLDIAIQNNREYQDACRARDQRLKEAGYDFFHTVLYKGEHVGVTDIQGDIAFVDYSGNQYQVRLEDIERFD